MDSGNPGLEREIQEIGARLHRAARGARPALFDLRGVRGRLLGAAMQDERLRSALFQFVDVLPALDTSEAIAAHFAAYLHGHRLAGAWGKLLEFGEHPWTAWAVKRSVRRLARQFLVEEEGDALERALAALSRIPAAVTVDAVGEAVLTEGEADLYLARNLALLHRLRSTARPQLSVKLSAFTPRFDPIDPEGTAQRVLTRLEPLLQEAAAAGAALTVDMEYHELKPLVLGLFRRIAERHREADWLPGIALQAYCPETERDLSELLDWAHRAGRRIGVRLVKGAYWDSEVALAAARGWPCPVYLQKAETDAAFERLTRLLFEHAELVHPAIASHSLRSIAHAVACARARGFSSGQWEVQTLYGMAEPLRDALPGLGVRVCVYLPSGDLLTGIAYLIRRLMENTANTSVLRQAYVEHQDLTSLLAAPMPPSRPQPSLPPALSPSPFQGEGRGGGSAPAASETHPFANTPLTDFSLAENRAAFARGLARVREQLGGFQPLAVPGASANGVVRAESRNPADVREVLGEVELAGPAHAERAVEIAATAFPAWRDTPAAERVRLCQRAAGIVLERRHEIAAWEVLETGKSWREADADVAEAVDHLRYYAAEMLRLDGWRPTRNFPAERNQHRYEPGGVAVVIAPWNFPIAILAGMSAAALVAGNTVIMKPAGPARFCAHRLWEALIEAGFPPQVCQCLPGRGELLGELLVAHPKVSIIAFTGSREVGLGILQGAHVPAPGQTHVKRVVCEMGGKNAIVVDADADLDEAVAQILASAFGYQGQKCSACSRLIAVGDIHDRLVYRLAEAVDAWPLGPPEDPHYALGPLVSAAAREKAERYLEIGQAEGRLHYHGHAPEGGHYFAPAIFTGIQPHHRLAREEIFAPILAVLRAGSFEQAVAMALDSDFALTGGVFSRLPEHLAMARERFRVGNLYLNRKITGALVAVQPFGGWRLSGTGIQAGGPDYLKQFLWSRVVSENTLRHGFVP